MSATLPILTEFETRLKTQFPDWDIQLMPDDPSHYFLSHPNGAVLISYAGSKFSEPRSTSVITQTRKVHIVFTVLSRNLHNDFGALQFLDELRLSVVGFQPIDCTPSWLVEEQFDEQDSGVWIYQLVLATETLQIQRLQAVDLEPKLTTFIARQEHQPLDARLKPKS
ncbi:Gp37 family protein [Glaesserella parasuis]|uniref:Gp37 family protein n=1 Tax=Glaesserella parasuis TaxID=738 RepID=UPI0013660DB7|nr:Gp37 family protein [Glaesserella parasuis]MDG6230712.1 Gp37 family protein [Glaesserella parasuis]MDO9925866.1 Gp37 family protein [Glaesserella parasuis]MDO9930412.1 Gp37 family protein [Glaesserella parasuis]MDO9981987.1 Gp37 family protein [Glaesserella parasuis]MDP0127934.1 Gp37 family protein [Glaesserella parasuis]